MLHYPDEIIEVITASQRVMQVRRRIELKLQPHRKDDPDSICGAIEILRTTLEDLYPWQLYVIAAVVNLVKGDGDLRDLIGVCSFLHYRYPESHQILDVLIAEADYLGAFLDLGQRQMNKFGMDPTSFFSPNSPCRTKKVYD